MNGRVYDYNLGRFLSVDPFIQAPGNSQSMNPYSYIMNNPLAGTDPSGYLSKCVDEGTNCEETVTPEAGDQIIEDKNGNRYIDKGGDTVTRIDKISATKNGVKLTIGVNQAPISGTDIGSVSEQNGASNLSSKTQKDSESGDGFIESAIQIFNNGKEGIKWRYEAVSEGLDKDFSEGFLEGVIRITGGRSNNGFFEDALINFENVSVVMGPVSEIDRKIIGGLVSGQLAKMSGGMTFGQWAKSGFRAAPHLQSRMATLGFVGRTSVINGVVVTSAYEGGNALGSIMRVSINRAARYIVDD